MLICCINILPTHPTHTRMYSYIIPGMQGSSCIVTHASCPDTPPCLISVPISPVSQTSSHHCFHQLQLMESVGEGRPSQAIPAHFFGALGVCGELPRIMGMWLETFDLWISANAFDNDFFGKQHRNIQTLILYRIRSQ